MKKSEPVIKTQVTQEALKGQVLPKNLHMPTLESYFQQRVAGPAYVTSYTTKGGRTSQTHGTACTYTPYGVIF